MCVYTAKRKRARRANNTHIRDTSNTSYQNSRNDNCWTFPKPISIYTPTTNCYHSTTVTPKSLRTFTPYTNSNDASLNTTTHINQHGWSVAHPHHHEHCRSPLFYGPLIANIYWEFTDAAPRGGAAAGGGAGGFASRGGDRGGDRGRGRGRVHTTPIPIFYYHERQLYVNYQPVFAS